jgi:hypothetical protein
MQLYIDGFPAPGPDDEQQWVTRAWAELKQHVLEMLETSDAILIGRILASANLPFLVNPIALCNGHPVFDRLATYRHISLQSSATCSSAVVLLQYTPRK